MKNIVVLILVVGAVTQLSSSRIEEIIANKSQIDNSNTGKADHSGHTPAPVVQLISIDDRYLFPRGLTESSENCFGPKHLIIEPGNSIRILATRPFITFFRTETSHTYYLLLKQPK